jgi:ABC-type glycerol-3-phosphate transport system permease component
MENRSVSQWIGLYVLAVIGGLIIIIPILWMLTIALRPSAQLYITPFPLLPPTTTLDNFINVLLNRTTVPAHLEQGVVRSLIVAVSTTVLAVAIASLAAYALARFNFRGKESYGIFMLVTQMMPAILFLVPLFEILRSLGLVNTLPGLILSYLTFSLPFCIWLLRGYFEGIAVDLEEAAITDGCSRLQALLRITLPLATPAMVATGAFAFINAWNEFLFAFILAGQQPLLTVQLYAFIGQYGPEYGNLMAAAVLIALPPVILFVLMQRHLIRGLTAGAVKG